MSQEKNFPILAVKLCQNVDLSELLNLAHILLYISTAIIFTKSYLGEGSFKHGRNFRFS